MNNKLEVIGIDHGWSMMKTVTQVFVTGVKEITTTPALFGDVLEYDGKYYKIGTVRQEVKDTKVEDDSFYLLTLADIIKKIISIYKEDGIGRKIDVSFFQDFEKVKEKLCFRLVNREKNREQLEKVPYIPILDLAICFYYAFDEAGVDNGMIPIYRSHLDNWKVTDRDLLEIAVKNTPRLFPGETIPMEDVLGDALQELPEEVRREFLRKVSMMILTNSRKTYGACSILYPGMLEQLAERIGGDYYMIPSSVHEFLLVPREREQDREELKKMIAEVNRTELPPEEVLSDHLYLYCSREREVKIV